MSAMKNELYNYMDFDYYQQEAKTFACYESSLYPVLGLAEEAGEVAGKFAKLVRGDGSLSIEDVSKELGDVLWMVSQCCEELGISMAEVADNNIAKLIDRKERQVIKGDGDNR